MPGLSMWIRREHCTISIVGLVRQSCSNPRAGKWTRSHICRNYVSPLASGMLRRRLSTTLRRPWQRPDSSCARSARTAIASTIRQRCGRSSATGERRSTTRLRSSLRFARSFGKSSPEARRFRSFTSRKTAKRSRTRPRLTLIVMDPEEQWRGAGEAAEGLGRWTRERGKLPRLYPGALVWCVRKPGREIRDTVELWLAWRRVAQEVSQGVLGTEFDRADLAQVHARVREAEEAARDEVWAAYRFVALWGPAGV